MSNSVRPTGAMPILEEFLELFGYRSKQRIKEVEEKFDNLDKQAEAIKKGQEETINVLKTK